MPYAASTVNLKVLRFPGVFTDKWSGSRDQGFKISAMGVFLGPAEIKESALSEHGGS